MLRILIKALIRFGNANASLNDAISVKTAFPAKAWSVHAGKSVHWTDFYPAAMRIIMRRNK
ncbi:hypothetical protein ACI50E_20600 [Brucella sp. ZJ1_1]|uniref:hypothetical protein n=1 Tax=Brucella TaxID=234 RepID=UPI00110F9287|nr:hypothetical protein [Brucella intermedia]MCB4917263.1 hypothetical protein [Brucella intermedia]NKB95664.1 hypothetical protein [Brucella intermedia]